MNIFTPGQVRDRARRPRFAMDKNAGLPDANGCVADDLGFIGKAFVLNISHGLKPLADHLAGFARPVAAQLFMVPFWNLDP